jgi:hypothetical protein
MGEVISMMMCSFFFVWLAMCCWNLAMWMFRKFREGLAQFRRFFIWLPGWAYVLAAVMGICDGLKVLPYGVRDVAAFLQEVKRENLQPVAEDKKPSPSSVAVDRTPSPELTVTKTAEPPPKKTVNVRAKPQEATTKPQPVRKARADSGNKGRNAAPAIDNKRQPAPAPNKPAPSEKEANARLPVSTDHRQENVVPDSNTSVRPTHVLEFHLSQHGNDPLHVTVHDDVNVGSLVAAMVHGEKITLQVLRPLSAPTGRRNIDKWLAVPVAEIRPMMAGTPP